MSKKKNNKKQTPAKKNARKKNKNRKYNYQNNLQAIKQHPHYGHGCSEDPLVAQNQQKNFDNFLQNRVEMPLLSQNETFVIPDIKEDKEDFFVVEDVKFTPSSEKKITPKKGKATPKQLKQSNAENSDAIYEEKQRKRRLGQKITVIVVSVLLVITMMTAGWELAIQPQLNGTIGTEQGEAPFEPIVPQEGQQNGEGQVSLPENAVAYDENGNEIPLENLDIVEEPAITGSSTTETFPAE